MYKVIIIDDEVLVRVGLKTTIDWEEIGFSVVAEASNGEQGFVQYKKHRPDVIITDIKMPKRDGLWLIEKIRKENQDIKILVLTCYDEFAVVRKALKSGVDDYILKFEIEDEELTAVMKTVKNKLDKQNKATNSHNKVKMNQNDIKRALLNDMIKTSFNIDEKIIERCSAVDFTLTNTKLAFSSIKIKEETIGNYSDPKSLKQINNALSNIIIDQLVDKNIEYIYNISMKNFVFLMSSSKLGLTQLKRIFASVTNAAKQYFDISLNIVYTDPIDDIKNIPILYKEFVKKSQIFFYDNDKLFFALNVNEINFKTINVFDLKKQYNKKFVEYIGQDNYDEIDNLIGEVSHYFEKNNINPRIVKIFYSNLIGDIFGSYGQFFKNSEEIMNHDDYHYKISNCDNLKNISNLLSDFIGKIIVEIRQSRHNNSKLIINRVLNYIEHNYDQKISLEDVAVNLNLSKHYLCSVFKKETGETMSLYINKLRIEKAKRILLSRDCKIKEIFEEVGYSNQQYFSKVFKKITGMTIIEFRDS